MEMQNSGMNRGLFID